MSNIEDENDPNHNNRKIKTMSTEFTIYLITMLDRLRAGLCVATIFASILGVLYLFALASLKFNDEPEDFPVKLFRTRNTVLITLLIFLVSTANVLTPSSKEAALIYIAPKIIDNKDVQEAVSKLPELSKEGINKLIEILKTDDKKSAGEEPNELH